jgi:hypothetical protein
VGRMCENSSIEFLWGNLSDKLNWKREERITFRLISGRQVIWKLYLNRIYSRSLLLEVLKLRVPQIFQVTGQKIS